LYRNRALAWRTYVEATHHLVDTANEIACKVVLISTDWAFDGTQIGADESTPPNPINYYGVLKVACERAVATPVAHAADVPDGVRVSFDTSLNAARTAQVLEYHLPTVREMLTAFEAQVTTCVLA
jgi:dTDP-4-dehydrorhamnose reductase